MDSQRSIEQEIATYDGQIGKRLAALRLQQGLKLQTLAIYSGVSQQQISKYEKGVSRITAGTLFQLASKMKLPIAMFFPETGEILKLHDMLKAEAEFICLLRALPAEQQKLMLDFMKARSPRAGKSPDLSQLKLVL